MDYSVKTILTFLQYIELSEITLRWNYKIDDVLNIIIKIINLIKGENRILNHCTFIIYVDETDSAKYSDFVLNRYRIQIYVNDYY